MGGEVVVVVVVGNYLSATFVQRAGWKLQNTQPAVSHPTSHTLPTEKQRTTMMKTIGLPVSMVTGNVRPSCLETTADIPQDSKNNIHLFASASHIYACGFSTNLRDTVYNSFDGPKCEAALQLWR